MRVELSGGIPVGNVVNDVDPRDRVQRIYGMIP